MKLFTFLASFLIVGSVFAVPAAVEAQSGRAFVCQSNSDGRVYAQPTTGCPSGYTSKPRPARTSFCIGRSQATSSWEIIIPPDNKYTTGGQAICLAADYPQYSSVSTTAVQAQIPGAPQTPTGPGTTPPINPNLPATNTNPGGTNPGTNPPTGTTPTGGCPSGTSPKGPICVPNNPLGTGGLFGGTIGEIAARIISILLTLAGMVAVIFVIIGGFYWMTARGNETQAANGRKTVINALIGLVIVVMSYLIVQIVTNFIMGGN